ncbi:hypothetical protein L1887_63203 [Cichorium endivia]|nr:hypothetical protein L1887_63203 [Cichorium endivia]
MPSIGWGGWTAIYPDTARRAIRCPHPCKAALTAGPCPTTVRPERLFALHLARLPLGEKGTPLLAATGHARLVVHVRAGCEPCCLSRGRVACTSAHVAYKSWRHGRFSPPTMLSPHQPVGNRGAVTYGGLASEHSRGGPSSAHWPASISSSSRASLHHRRLSRNQPPSKPRSDHSWHSQSWRRVTCSANAQASMQGPIPTARNLISGTLRANEARGRFGISVIRNEIRVHNIVHARALGG